MCRDYSSKNCHKNFSPRDKHRFSKNAIRQRFGWNIPRRAIRWNSSTEGFWRGGRNMGILKLQMTYVSCTRDASPNKNSCLISLNLFFALGFFFFFCLVPYHSPLCSRGRKEKKQPLRPILRRFAEPSLRFRIFMIKRLHHHHIWHDAREYFLFPLSFCSISCHFFRPRKHRLPCPLLTTLTLFLFCAPVVALPFAKPLLGLRLIV